MKQFLLTFIIVASLASVTIGGTLADFSDIETSHNNSIGTGSLDLKVNGEDDPDIDTVIEVTNVAPGEVYGPFECQVSNEGEAQNADGSVPPSYLYLHIKQLVCANVNPPNSGYAYEDENITTGDNLKPEPELVAEYGGSIDCTWVPGVGRLGDNCTMPSYTEVTVYFDGYPIIQNEKLGDLECHQIYLGELEPYGVFHTVSIYVQVLPISEADAVAAGILGTQYFGDSSIFWFWPTNGLMYDKVSFNIAFELFQFPLP